MFRMILVNNRSVYFELQYYVYILHFTLTIIFYKIDIIILTFRIGDQISGLGLRRLADSLKNHPTLEKLMYVHTII